MTWLITKDSESWDDIGMPAIVKETAVRSCVRLSTWPSLPTARRKQILDGSFLFRCLQAKPVRGQLELAANARQQEGQTMTEPSVSFAGNLTDDPKLRHTEAGIARAMFQVAVSGRREQEPSFFTVVVWRDQAEHAAQSLRRAAGSWSWVGCSSGAGPLRTAAPAPPSRCWPRSWGRVCGGRWPCRPGSPRTAAPSDSWWSLSHWLMAPPWTGDFR